MIDIGSKFEFPASVLSNFTPNSFTIDGVECASMEGFLQSLKEICQLTGVKAKKRGGKCENWKKTQTLWWQGQKIDRQGVEYQKLLNRAFNELAKNEKFKKALSATDQEVLIHSIGKSNQFETVLTEEEFCSRLMKLRREIAS